MLTMEEEDRDSHHLLFYWVAFSSFMSSLSEAAVPHPCWRSEEDSSLTAKATSTCILQSKATNRKGNSPSDRAPKSTTSESPSPSSSCKATLSPNTQKQGEWQFRAAVLLDSTVSWTFSFSLFSADKEEDSTHQYFFYCLFIRASKFYLSLYINLTNAGRKKKKTTQRLYNRIKNV